MSSAGAKAASPGVIVLLGHSIAHGVGATDTTYGGASLPGGIAIRDAGVNLSAYPSSAGTGPDPGVLPYLAASLGSGTIIRRAQNGQTLAGLETDQIAAAIGDCIALGIAQTDVQLVILMIGENDSNNASEASAYAARIAQTCDLVELAWPNARIVIQDQRSEDAVYSEYATIRSANAAAAALRATRRVASYAGIGLHDAVHYSLAGYATAAAAQWAAWVAAA